MKKATSNPVQQIEKLRERVAEIAARLSASEDPVRPKAQAYESADDMIDSLAETAPIYGHQFAMGGRRPRLDEAEDVLRFVTWLDPERAKARLHAVIDEFYDSLDGSIPVDSPELRAELSKLADEKFQLEVEEERLITDAIAQGYRIARRGDADPRAVLAA